MPNQLNENWGAEIEAWGFLVSTPVDFKMQSSLTTENSLLTDLLYKVLCILEVSLLKKFLKLGDNQPSIPN